MPVTKDERSPYYQYRFQINGESFRGSTRCKSRREAEAFELEKRAEVEAALAREKKPDESLDAIFEKYWNNYGSKLAGAKWNCADHLKEALEILGPETIIGDVKTADILNVLEVYAATGVSNSTVNRRMSAIRKVWIAAKLADIPVAEIHWSKLKRQEPKPRTDNLTVVQVRDVLPLLKRRHIQLLFLFCVVTGARLDEAMSLEWRWVQWKERRARAWTKARRVGSGIEGKQSRWLMLNRLALAILKECMGNQHDKAFEEEGYRPGLVFSSRNRRRHWEAARAQAGLAHFHWHDMRHTYASWLGTAGADLLTLKELLGHNDIATTQKYTHLARSGITRTNDMIDGLGLGSLLFDEPENQPRTTKLRRVRVYNLSSMTKGLVGTVAKTVVVDEIEPLDEE